jgi:[ribosomal protein S18]-alanine N-acetyltransferase
MRAKSTSAVESLIVRRCERADLAAIADILAEAPEAATWSASALEEALENNSKYFLIASKGNNVVGFVLGRKITDETEILNLALKPEYRRQGIGKTLVQTLLMNFEADAASTVFLEVRESNTVAIDFYRAHGFLPSGKRPGYYQNPSEAALVFALQLARDQNGNSPESKFF